MNPDWIDQPLKPINQEARTRAEARQGQLTKPPGSLGRLEELAIRLAGQQGEEKPRLEQVAITVFAADHGVAEAGVSAFPQEVTAQMVANFAHGGAAISVLSRSQGVALEVVDVGTKVDAGPLLGVVSQRVAAGTANFAEGDAMDADQLAAALEAGKQAAERAVENGAKLFIGGDMGIGNTTPAAAIACALLEKDATELAGPGTGLDSDGVAHKAQVINTALARYQGLASDPLETLRRVGGFEIAALAGAYLRAAQLGIPSLVDGYITTAAALVAVRHQPALRDWLLFSHRSAEPGHKAMLEALQADPLLDLGMRLGEGSGAATALPLLRHACELHAGMATFAEAGVADG